jgi:hypothetical protein
MKEEEDKVDVEKARKNYKTGNSKKGQKKERIKGFTKNKVKEKDKT